MWITCLLLLAAWHSMVKGFDYIGDSEEDLYRDLDNWNYNRGSHLRLNAPASSSQVISAAEHSLAAAKAVVVARKHANEAIVAAKKAADAAALAAKHAKLAAQSAANAASRSAAHLSKVPGGSSSATRRRGSSAAAAAAAVAAAVAGRKPGSSAAAAAAAAVAAARKPGSSSAAGRKPSSASGRTGAAGSSARPTSARATPTGTGSSASCGAKSLNVELKFLTMPYHLKYRNKNHRDTAKLASIMCNKIKTIFKSGEVCKCTLNTFRPGSVLADFSLQFRSSVQNAKQKIEAALQKGFLVGPYKAASRPNIYNIKGFTKSGGKADSKVACKPCKNLAPGVKMVSQTSCPTGYCATLMINPSQIIQAQSSPAPAQPAQPASSLTFSQSMMSPYSACPAMCQPSPPTYSCAPGCPTTCCRRG